MYARTFIAASAVVLGSLGCRGGDIGFPTEPAFQTPQARPDFALVSNTWVRRADLPANWLDLATAAVPRASQSIVYAFNGSRVLAYNVSTNIWTAKAPQPVGRTNTNGAGVLNGKIYISGGFAPGWVPLRALYMYDPATNKWTQKRSMLDDGYSGITGVINGRLYVLTHCDIWDCATGNQVSFARYNPTTDQWSRLPRPVDAHNGGMGGTIGGKFYVVGGAYSRKLEVYDPATNTWTTKTPLPRPLWSAAGATLAAKLYVIGGMQLGADGTTITTIRTTRVYDPATNTWTTKAPMPSPRDGISASRVSLNGQTRIEVMGGPRPGNNLQYTP